MCDGVYVIHNLGAHTRNTFKINCTTSSRFSLLHSRGSKQQRLLRPRRRHNTEAVEVVANDGRDPVAVGGAEVVGIGEPRTAAQHPVLSSTTFPRAPVCRRSIITIMIPILTPLPHIPVHVI